MLSREHERIMGKNRALPGDGLIAVTGFAVGGKAQALMVRIRCRIEVVQVTAHACGWAPFELPIGMAVRAQRLGMLPIQHERHMRELGSFPGRVTGAVADGTVRGESGGRMIRLLGALIIRRMACGALL